MDEYHPDLQQRISDSLVSFWNWSTTLLIIDDDSYPAHSVSYDGWHGVVARPIDDTFVYVVTSGSVEQLRLERIRSLNGIECDPAFDTGVEDL